ncbi:type II toxin-antitoxin system VapB family antitoxin [Lamprocystis purpurea]|jgi:uncharacterized protein with PIN domain|uniref:type II toxin-antitoxin system VapB family antitoxin n=1 Tax=Lamprocystis purpurea TaxID=61598 RepID=UPI00037ABE4B|nr:type II toxin-antitoxin system VapB family antitoxin [Lamprocystis purpurea]
MALNIRNAETEHLAARLASLTGETKTACCVDGHRPLGTACDYALALTLDEPLLYKCDDVPLTDVRAAFPARP